MRRPPPAEEEDRAQRNLTPTTAYASYSGTGASAGRKSHGSSVDDRIYHSTVDRQTGVPLLFCPFLHFIAPPSPGGGGRAGQRESYPGERCRAMFTPGHLLIADFEVKRLTYRIQRVWRRAGSSHSGAAVRRCDGQIQPR